MTKRAVLYARVSGDDRDNEGRNLASQLDICRKYAREKGYEVVAELAEDDKGASGATFELPQLTRALKMAHAGEFDVLVPRELDRLSRDIGKQFIVETELSQFGVQIEYALYDYPDTMEGRLMKNVRASIAEYEREAIALRTIRGRRNKALSGHVVAAGRVAYGYRRAAVNGNGVVRPLTEKEKPAPGERATLVPYEPEAQVIRHIFSWYTEGNEKELPLTLRAIARKLAGVPTFADANGVAKQSEAGYWSKGAISYILKNEVYCGRWHFGRHKRVTDPVTRKQRIVETAPGQSVIVDVPAIVDRAAWEAAQARLKENREDSRRNRKHEYLLSGRIRCGECGAAMSGRTVSNGHKSGTWSYYRCNSRPNYDGIRHCSATYFRSEEVDQVVWDWATSILHDKLVLDLGLKEYQADAEGVTAPTRARLQIVDGLLADRRAQFKRLLDLYLSEGFPKEMLVERRARLETEVEALEEERAALSQELEGRTLTPAQVAGLQAYADQVRADLKKTGTDFESRRNLLRRLRLFVVLSFEDGVKMVRPRFLAWTAKGPLVVGRPLVEEISTS